jgi:hypothetical protein
MPLGSAPYISPTTLVSAPTGIDWGTIPPGRNTSPQAKAAEQWNICQRVTDRVNGYCNQVLAATADIELLHGPDFRLTVGPGGGGASRSAYWGTAGPYNARALMSRWPILGISQVTYCAGNVWPRAWQTVPTGYYEPEAPPIGIYGSIAPSGSAYGSQAVLIAPGYIDWRYGRNGYAVQVSYTNGWPHAELTANATAGSTVLTVNDTTGWALTSYQGQLGATGVIKDSGQQETGHCTAATTTAGPGNLLLSAPTAYPHEAGTIFTTLPYNVEEACILFGVAEALTRGATSTTIHDIGGHAQSSSGDIASLITEGELLIHPYRRTI